MGTPYHANDIPGSWSVDEAFIAQFGLNPLVTGIPVIENDSVSSLSVFPNPAGNNITIAGDVNANDLLTIEIVDVLGQVVYSENLQPAYSVNKSIDVSNLADGMYIVRVVSDQTVYTNKILIQE